MTLDQAQEKEINNLVNEPVPQFMTLEEVAQRLQVSRRTINRYIIRKNKPLPVVYLSDKTPRVPWEQFNLWIDSMMEGGELT